MGTISLVGFLSGCFEETRTMVDVWFYESTYLAELPWTDAGLHRFVRGYQWATPLPQPCQAGSSGCRLGPVPTDPEGVSGALTLPSWARSWPWLWVRIWCPRGSLCFIRMLVHLNGRWIKFLPGVLPGLDPHPGSWFQWRWNAAWALSSSLPRWLGCWLRWTWQTLNYHIPIHLNITVNSQELPETLFLLFLPLVPLVDPRLETSRGFLLTSGMLLLPLSVPREAPWMGEGSSQPS